MKKKRKWRFSEHNGKSWIHWDIQEPKIDVIKKSIKLTSYLIEPKKPKKSKLK